MPPVTVARRRADIHKVVVASVRKLSREAPAVKVATIARDTRKDPRTVLHHLEMMEASGNVVFLDKEHSVIGVPEQLAKALRGAILEPWERGGMDELKDIWDNDEDAVFDRL